MISKWKVQNFKSISQETELDFAPLTIFSGSNSSGKSTFIQSILLIAQTLNHKVSSRSVVLNGSLATLGQFDDLKSNNSEIDQIIIKLTCRPIFQRSRSRYRNSTFDTSTMYYRRRAIDQLQEIACEVAFDADPSSSERELLQIQPRLVFSQLACVSRDDDNVDSKTDIIVRHSNKAISEIIENKDIDELDDQLRASLTYAVELGENVMIDSISEFKHVTPIGCALRHFLPERVVYIIDSAKEKTDIITSVLTGKENAEFISRRHLRSDIQLPSEVLSLLQEVVGKIIDLNKISKGKSRQISLFDNYFDTFTLREWDKYLRSMTNEIQETVYKQLKEKENLFEQIYKIIVSHESRNNEILQSSPSRSIADATWYLNNTFAASVKYLGPLRDAPKPLYPIAPNADPYDVGIRGEHTASILELHKNRQIKYMPSEEFTNSNIEKRPIIRSLESAVIDWLQYLGIAESVESKDQGKLGHELKVRLANSENMHDLTHVGVGVSQVLPILVMCLLADEDSTLIFEQPELHLHPKVQTLLGDFFLSMSLCNKQCVIETHSEYLIDRIRFRIAAANETNSLEEKVKIYFAEKTTQSSSFREVNINEYGAISDWPDGFFDQSQQEAERILKAAALKRRSNRTNKNE